MGRLFVDAQGNKMNLGPDAIVHRAEWVPGESSGWADAAKVAQWKETQRQTRLVGGQHQRMREDMGHRDFRLSGQVAINGSGEVKTDVKFDVPFSEKPLFSFGSELREPFSSGQSSWVAGNAPMVSATVLSWDTFERPPATRMYTGAQVLYVIKGAPSQRIYVHWHFFGLASMDMMHWKSDAYATLWV